MDDARTDAGLPAPLVPADCDCTDLDGFMLNVERLQSSELVALATPEELAAALMLWCRAWKQVPAASLPADDRVLAAFARSTPARWPKIKAMALRGFVRCSDGRLYHKVLAEEAIRAFERKEAFRHRRDRDAQRLRNWRKGGFETTDETPTETRFKQPTKRVSSRKDRDRDSTIPPQTPPPGGLGGCGDLENLNQSEQPENPPSAPHGLRYQPDHPPDFVPPPRVKVTGRRPDGRGPVLSDAADIEMWAAEHCPEGTCHPPPGADPLHLRDDVVWTLSRWRTRIAPAVHRDRDPAKPRVGWLDELLNLLLPATGRAKSAAHRGDADAVVAWLADGIPPWDALEAVRAAASRPGCPRTASLAFFDAAVRRHRAEKLAEEGFGGEVAA